MVRTPSYDKNGVKRGAWSREEDNKLRDYIERYGYGNWRELPKFAGLARCGKSCRLRWMNYLRPNVKRGNFTKEEDDLIIKLHEQLGNKWSVFAAKLPGRTDNEIKNHWHTKLKRRTKQNPPKSEVREQYSSTTCRPKAEQKKRLMEPKKDFADDYHESPQILESSLFSRELSSTEFLEVKGFADDESPQILESCSLSPELSFTESSSLSSNYTLESGIKCVPEDGISWSSEAIFEELNGDFWTKPFLADNSYEQNDFQTSVLADGGCFSPYVSYYDDCVDLFYQLM